MRYVYGTSRKALRPNLEPAASLWPEPEPVPALDDEALLDWAAYEIENRHAAHEYARTLMYQRRSEVWHQTRERNSG